MAMKFDEKAVLSTENCKKQVNFKQNKPNNS